MRIAYCASLRLPSERANGHQVARVCDALVKGGADVTIFAPERRNPVTEDFWTYHGVDRRVKLTYVPAFDHVAFRWVPGFLGLRLHVRNYVRHLLPLLGKQSFDVLYTRMPVLLAPLLATGVPVAIELHALPRFGARRFAALCSRCKQVICLTTPLRDELIRLGVRPQLCSVEGDAVEASVFAQLPDRDAAREQWKIPADAFVAAYAGSLKTMGLSKGVEQIVTAVLLLRSYGIKAVALIAGGPPGEALRLEQQSKALGAADAVRILGPLPHAEVASVLAACDAAVYPAPASQHPYFRRDTSPLKLFEYAAAGRPVVAADLPPIRDVLDEHTAQFYRPGDVQSLAAELREIHDHADAARERAAKAAEKVKEHTWEKRMGRILSTLS